MAGDRGPVGDRDVERAHLALQRQLARLRLSWDEDVERTCDYLAGEAARVLYRLASTAGRIDTTERTTP